MSATTSHPITITTTNGHTTWQAVEAAAFISATPAGIPSANSCCTHLNFFTDQATAEAWITARPHIPGQILTQPEAEALGTRLFAHLLAP